MTAEKVYNITGSKLYCIWTPPHARGVWLSSWSTIAAHFRELAGEQKYSIESALNCFPRSENVRIFRGA